MKKVVNTENDLVTMDRRKRLKLVDVSASMVYDFIVALQEGRGYSGEVNGNNTIAKKLSELRGFLLYLERKRLHTDTSYDKVRVEKYEPEEPTYTEEELTAISNFDVEAVPGFRKVHMHARDLYIFCGETAVTFRDISKFVKPSNIHALETEFGIVKVLRFRRSKTSVESTIPLSKRAVSILEKYEYSLPKTTNQECNRCIKEIARAVGIKGMHTFIKWVGEERIENTVPRWKAIKFHSSRRSWITNYLMADGDVKLAGKVAGQKSIATTMGYFKPGADRQMKRFIEGNISQFI
jgi:site-specific recombinase XerD